MPWKELQVLDQRTEFVPKSLSRDVVFTTMILSFMPSKTLQKPLSDRREDEGMRFFGFKTC
jgi:hypothetical protein